MDELDKQKIRQGWQKVEEDFQNLSLADQKMLRNFHQALKKLVESACGSLETKH